MPQNRRAERLLEGVFWGRKNCRKKRKREKHERKAHEGAETDLGPPPQTQPSHREAINPPEAKTRETTNHEYKKPACQKVDRVHSWIPRGIHEHHDLGIFRNTGSTEDSQPRTLRWGCTR